MVYASRCDGTCILQVLFGKRTTLRVRTCVLQVLFGERTTLRVRTACTLSKCSGPRRQLADIYFGRRCRRPQLFCSSPWPGGFSHYCSTGLADHRVRDRQGRGVKMLQAAHHQQPPPTTRWRASPVWSTPACSLVRTCAAALPAPITLRCIWPSSHLTVTPPRISVCRLPQHPRPSSVQARRRWTRWRRRHFRSPRPPPGRHIWTPRRRTPWRCKFS